MKTEKKSLEPRLSNYKDYYYKYKKEFLRNSFALERSSNKALKYYLEKQKRTKGGVGQNDELPPPPQLMRDRFDRENVIRESVERAIRELQLTHENYNNAAVQLNIEGYRNACNIILHDHGADEVTNRDFLVMMGEIIRADMVINQIEQARREQENRNRQAADQGYNQRFNNFGRRDGADGGM